MISNLPQHVLNSVSRHQLDLYLTSEPLVVGVSGGADSLALLHVLCELRGKRAAKTLHVAHLDHGFRGVAGAQDAAFVEDMAQKMGLPFTGAKYDVPEYARSRGLSKEEAARRARYAFLGGLAEQQAATVAVAHTADDQVETVLMNILRGSGLKGLAGMQMLSPLPLYTEEEVLGLPVPAQTAQVRVFRPLLETWRSDVEAYCQQLGLQPRQDETNSDPTFTRNRIRHHLIPLLEKEYSPAIKEHLLNLSEIASAEYRLLDGQTEAEARRLAQITASGNEIRFKQAEFAQLPEAIRWRLARWALEQVAGTLEGLTFRHTREASNIIAGDEGSPRTVMLPHGLAVERFDGWSSVSKGLRGRRIAALEPEAEEWPVIGEMAVPVVPGETIPLSAGWELRSSIEPAGVQNGSPGDLLALFDMDALPEGGALILRPRREGDFMHPLGMAGRKTLQDLFVDAKIPRWMRHAIPVVALSVDSGEVLWVPGPGGRRSARAAVGPDTRRVLRLEFIRSGEVPNGTATSRGTKSEASKRRH